MTQPVIGIDEVGRGSIAGPLCMAAVFLCEPIEGLADSKMLTHTQRQKLALAIKTSAYVGLGWVSATEMNSIGLGLALREAAFRAVTALPQDIFEANAIVIDGSIDFLSQHSRLASAAIVKADTTIPAVMAASIVAKEGRDAVMRRYEALYPQYGFASHVGYGTAKHFAAIERFGLSSEHRICFPKVAEAGKRSGYGTA